MVVAGAKAVGISPMSRVGCESLKARAFAVPKPLKTTLIHSKSNINEIFGKTITNREILKQKNCGLVCLAAQENGNGASLAPSPADTARTIVDLVAHGTLSSLTEDGTPLGTYVSYVLDQVGQPILRLRKDAAHTANLMRENRCSLFIQPGEYPTHLLARMTLIGSVEPVSEDIAVSAAELHYTLHSGGAGVDKPKEDDLYYRLVVDECFYVGQLSGNSAADIISGDEYRAADADPLRTFASSMVKSMNESRMEDVYRIAAQKLGANIDDLSYGELLWLDKDGVYLNAAVGGGEIVTLRVPFDREVVDERDARSALTMMAQLAWEKDRPYSPTPIAASNDN